MAGPLPRERDVLISNYANLTSTVRDVDRLLPHFVSARIINDDDIEEIRAVSRTSERVAKLLKYISGPLDAGFTTSFYKMLDIMYNYGNDGTSQLAVNMKRKLGIPVPTQSSSTATAPAQVSQPQRQPDVVSCSNGSSTNDNGASASSSYIKKEVLFDEEDGGKGIIDHHVFDEKKKAVCRVHGPQTVGSGFIGYVGVDGEYFVVLVTCYHVIPSLEDAKCSRITFENSDPIKLCDLIVDTGPTTFMCSPEGEFLETGKISGISMGIWKVNVNVNWQLDFAIIKLDDAKLKLGIEPINLNRPANIKYGDQIYVIQYPFGGNLSFSASPCSVLGPLLLYKSGTVQGSSGSPVLKEVRRQLVPVGLHRGGNSHQPPFRGTNFGTLFSEILNCISGQGYAAMPSETEVQEVLATIK